MERSRRRLSFGQAAPDVSTCTCSLCLGHHQQFSAPESWRSEDARAFALTLNISVGDPVCYTCRKDLTRVLFDGTYVPRWEKAHNKSDTSQCCVVQCSHKVFASLHKATSDQLRSTFHTAGLECTTPVIPIPCPLCKHHYHLVYILVQPTQTHCATCGVSLKHSNPKSCPNLELIEKYLHENADYDGHINNDDNVCYTCYRAHLVILKGSHAEKSADSGLQHLITTLSDQLHVPSETTSIQEAIDTSMKRVVVYVGRQLLNRNALLLPSVHSLLCQYVHGQLSANNLEAGDIAKMVTSRWVLSSLTAALQNHIAYQCPVRKYGTLIYRPHNTDLRPALSQALWMSRDLKIQTCMLLKRVHGLIIHRV